MEDFKNCPHCNGMIPKAASFCEHCGKAVAEVERHTKFCQHCGEKIDKECVICPKCGKQLEAIKYEQPQIVINNANTNTNANINGRPKKEINKWVAFFLCLFLGGIGAHRFYEGKVGSGILYLLTLGLLGFGALIDLIIILTKPNPYYV